jgi:hypothetical protein
LVDYATAKSLQDGDIPKIIRICIREIDQRGLESEGIYRVCAIFQSVYYGELIRCTGVGSTCRCPGCKVLIPNFCVLTE